MYELNFLFLLSNVTSTEIKKIVIVVLCKENLVPILFNKSTKYYFALEGELNLTRPVNTAETHHPLLTEVSHKKEFSWETFIGDVLRETTVCSGITILIRCSLLFLLYLIRFFFCQLTMKMPNQIHVINFLF